MKVVNEDYLKGKKTARGEKRVFHEIKKKESPAPVVKQENNDNGKHLVAAAESTARTAASLEDMARENLRLVAELRKIVEQLGDKPETSHAREIEFDIIRDRNMNIVRVKAMISNPEEWHGSD